jgi:hypothetical protein
MKSDACFADVLIEGPAQMSGIQKIEYSKLPKLMIPIQGRGWDTNGYTCPIVNGAFHPNVVSSAANLSRFKAASTEWIKAIDQFQSHAQRYYSAHRFKNYIYQSVLFEMASNIFMHSPYSGQLELQFAAAEGCNSLEISAVSRGTCVSFGSLLLSGWQVEDQRGHGLFSIIGHSDEFSLLSVEGPEHRTIVKSTIYEIAHELRPPQKMYISMKIPPIEDQKTLDIVRLAGWFETVDFNKERLKLISMDDGPVGRYAEWILSHISEDGIKP